MSSLQRNAFRNMCRPEIHDTAHALRATIEALIRSGRIIDINLILIKILYVVFVPIIKSTLAIFYVHSIYYNISTKSPETRIKRCILFCSIFILCNAIGPTMDNII